MLSTPKLVGRELDPIPYDYEELTIDSNVTVLTAAKVRVSDAVWVRFDDGPMRFRIDGGDPSATVGWPLNDGDQIQLSSHEMRLFKAIRTGATNGKARAIYYKSPWRP